MKNFLSLLLSFLLIIAIVPLVSLTFKDEIIELTNKYEQEQSIKLIQMQH